MFPYSIHRRIYNADVPNCERLRREKFTISDKRNTRDTSKKVIACEDVGFFFCKKRLTIQKTEPVKTVTSKRENERVSPTVTRDKDPKGRAIHKRII